MPSTLATLNTATLNTLAAEGGQFASHRGGDHEGGGFFFLLLLLALIGGGIYLFRRRRNGGAVAVAPTPPAPSTPPVSDARALLDERFAKGEIDQAEYEHRRAVLEGRPTTPPVPEPPAAPSEDASDTDEENQ